jgi:hypothetical protein
VPLHGVRGAQEYGPVGAGAIKRRTTVGGIIYLVGLVVVILAILSFLGLR